jgi:hypothetical protein
MFDIFCKRFLPYCFNNETLRCEVIYDIADFIFPYFFEDVLGTQVLIVLSVSVLACVVVYRD